MINHIFTPFGCVNGIKVAGRQLPLHEPINGEFGIYSQLLGQIEDRCDNYGICTATSCPRETTCIPVWTGIRCECELGKRYDTTTESCEDIDDCLESSGVPCYNGGVCIDGINSYTCSCSMVYTGSDCLHINGVTIMIILIVIILFFAVVLLPFILWLLFRLIAQRNKNKHSKRDNYSKSNNSQQQIQKLKKHTQQFMENIQSRIMRRNRPARNLSPPLRNTSPPLRNISPPLRNISPPLANYPPEYYEMNSRSKFPETRRAHTFPSSNIPKRNHSNTMPPRPYSPPISNPMSPEPVNSIPGKRLIRTFNIYDQFI
ncbi:hypothetical protein LOD99_10098 [Oopsacas minuta]|uniref:Uncharacterized protein n=1 Tax=Oopsacas minuta TaxID=111878 RepID=A0AAV7KIK0_9METZ|nr:hypothetical protein LOD99_10098 [Oopsacas minuta]